MGIGDEAEHDVWFSSWQLSPPSFSCFPSPPPPSPTCSLLLALFYCIDVRLVEVLMCDEVPSVEAMSPW